jgi:dolichol-phosphate mannosyltransferase
MPASADISSPFLTVLVPTRNEADNIRRLVSEIDDSLKMLANSYVILFVDDSDDRTPSVIRDLRLPQSSRGAIHLIERTVHQRWGGLSGAVVDGLRASTTPYVCVMDADLQHPPPTIRQLLGVATAWNTDVVVASRYCRGGGAEEFGLGRSAISRMSILVAKALFPRRLRQITDPMSGFFILRLDAVAIDRLVPTGFKILLEIVLRSDGLNCTEVGYPFRKRHAGKSKGSLREGGRYLRHLVKLRLSRGPANASNPSRGSIVETVTPPRPTSGPAMVRQLL